MKYAILTVKNALVKPVTSRNIQCPIPVHVTLTIKSPDIVQAIKSSGKAASDTRGGEGRLWETDHLEDLGKDGSILK